MDKVELWGKRLWKALVRFLRIEKKDSTAFLSPKVSCLNLRRKIRKASGYQGPLSTTKVGLFLQNLSVDFIKVVASKKFLVVETQIPKHSIVSTSIAVQT